MNVKPNITPFQLNLEFDDSEVMLIEALNEFFYDYPETAASLAAVIGKDATELLMKLVDEIDISLTDLIEVLDIEFE